MSRSPLRRPGWGFYTAFDLVGLGLLALGVWSLARAVRSRRARRGPLRRWLQVLPALLAATALGSLPLLAGYGWAGLWTWAPDLTALVAALAVLATATAGVRLVSALVAPPARP